VAALSSNPQTPFAAVHGAGARLAFDLAGDGLAWVLSTGQSGHPLSEHYVDQTERWQRGQYLPARDGPGPQGPLVLLPARTP
jgi:penicillin amidase